MLPLIAVAARLAQFSAALILFGAPLFFIYGLPAKGAAAAASLRWPRPLFLGAAIVLLLGAWAALCAQTGIMTDAVGDALKPDVVASVVTGTQFGLITALRGGLAILAGLTLWLVRPGRGLWIALAGSGGVILASFAWSGHGAADEGPGGLLHLVADMIHLWAAGVWIGALAVLALLLAAARRQPDPVALRALHRGLEGFSGVGTAVVAALIATGLVNSWFLIGPSHLLALFSALYGLLLIAKLIVFAGMLALAAANRFQLTPRLASALESGGSAEAIGALQRSVAIECLAALAVIALVSMLGTIAPLSAVS
ncbi:MAG: copper resistance protein CopD [Caulobacteraceae bacterium]|nr:copper resistance protein CopD [Caulobacteraceae bacterium]